jgi:adenylylsulfate reductase subunit A
MGLFSRRKTHFVDSDVLVIGGGMAGCGATYEARHWGRDLKIVCVEKANIERSGAVAQGLYAINCYMGMQWDENQPEDHVRYARNDLMGLVREDLGYDMARHVDSTVHMFDKWGLPMMKDPETGRYQREGKWQIMIHGESYKPIVAEAARKAATEVYNRIMVTHLLMDDKKENRVAGAVGFNVRTGDFYVFRAKAVIVAAGGASHIYKPRAVGEGMGRTWYAPWSSASAYALPIEVGAKMTQMENRIVLTRFKDGYGPVGAYFLHLKTYTENAYGNEYESTWYENTKELVGDYIDRHPVPTCLRNHAFLEEVKAGRGPIRMVTKEAFKDPHLEQVGWENFLGMTIGQAVVWASQDIDPKHTNPELTTSEPYVMGSHATCSGAWASGPEDYAPDEYQWGYNRMMTVDGLFGAGDQVHQGHGQGCAAGQRGRIPESQEEGLPVVGELRGWSQRNRRRNGIAELHTTDAGAAASREDHGRICRRNQLTLYDQRATADARTGTAGHTQGRPRAPGCGGPAPAAACLGIAASRACFGIGNAPHDVPQRDPLAGVLLSWRSHETGRSGLALLHLVPVRQAFG